MQLHKAGGGGGTGGPKVCHLGPWAVPLHTRAALSSALGEKERQKDLHLSQAWSHHVTFQDVGRMTAAPLDSPRLEPICISASTRKGPRGPTDGLFSLSGEGGAQTVTLSAHLWQCRRLVATAGPPHGRKRGARARPLVALSTHRNKHAETRRNTALPGT